MTTTEETATANQNYNQLTGLKLFAMTSSMVISIDEFAPFGKAGATSLFTSCWPAWSVLASHASRR